MKILITEGKLFDSIYKYIDEYFNPNEIDWVYDTDDDGDEIEHLLIFFKGDWYDEEDSDVIFNYIEEEYYSDEPSAKSFKDESPVLDVKYEYAERLDTMFGNRWKEPIKKWFQDNFNLPVKTVTTYY